MVFTVIFSVSELIFIILCSPVEMQSSEPEREVQALPKPSSSKKPKTDTNPDEELFTLQVRTMKGTRLCMHSLFFVVFSAETCFVIAQLKALKNPLRPQGICSVSHFTSVEARLEQFVCFGIGFHLIQELLSGIKLN